MVKQIISILLLSSVSLFAGYLQEGNKLYESNQFEEAKAAYRKALSTQENKALVFLNLGNCFFREDSLPKAAAAYRSSIEYAPDFFRPYYNLTMVYYHLEDLPKAVITAQRALEIDTSNSTLLLMLATFYRELQNHSEAIILLERERENLWNVQQYSIILYELYREIGDIKSALNTILESDDSILGFEKKQLLLGHIYREQNELSLAEVAYSKAAERGEDAHYYLIKLLFDRGNNLSGMLQAERSLKKYPKLTNVALLAAEQAMKLTWYQKAEQFYLHAYQQGESAAHIGLQNLLKIYSSHDAVVRMSALERVILNSYPSTSTSR